MPARLPVSILAFYSVCSLTAMAPMNIGFFVVFFFFLILSIRQKNAYPADLGSLPEFRTYLVSGSLLFGACLLSLSVARILPVSYAGHAPDITVHGFLKIWYLFCPLVLASVFARSAGTEDDLKLIVRFWWAMTCVLALVAVIQFYTGWPIAQVIPTNPNHFHAILFFGHHLSTSSIIIFPAFTALSVALGSFSRNRKILKTASVVACLGLLILFLSYARTAWLAIPICLILVFARHLKPKTLATFCL